MQSTCRIVPCRLTFRQIHRNSAHLNGLVYFRPQFRHGQRHGPLYRKFHAASRWQMVKPFVLADIGEGIKEVQIIQWFVQPGARVEQFDKLCEVASDKAITEITSRFDGVIKKLHYEPEAMAQVGKPLCDIDIQSEITAADEALVTLDSDKKGDNPPNDKTPPQIFEGSQTEAVPEKKLPPNPEPAQPSRETKVAHLATPAVRGLLKEHNLNIADVAGTGKDGRVLKEDIYNHLESLKSSKAEQPRAPPSLTQQSDQQTETPITLTPVQHAMFKTMTRSLTIPHFLYTTDVDLTALTSLRRRLNASASRPSVSPAPSPPPKLLRLTALPFIIKALSLTLHEYSLLNSRLETSSSPSSPEPTPHLFHRLHHNIGLAVSTPAGLVVPVIRNAATLTIPELAAKISELSLRAREGKLSPADLQGATITVSNIGNIGGAFVAPVIVQGQVAILGIGRAREVLQFSREEGGDEEDGDGGGFWGERRGMDWGVVRQKGGRRREVVSREVAGFCWSADHRVLDGAYVAKAAERVKGLLEDVGKMVGAMR